MADIRIHTLEARDNAMLEVLRDEFDLTPVHIRREIELLLGETTAVLHNKGIEYSHLRSALVPSADRNEIVLLFDTLRIDDYYGRRVHERLIPLFEPEASFSVLEGDLVSADAYQDRLRSELEQHLQPANSLEWRHSRQYYAVYVNNLSDAMFSSLHSGLSNYSPYVGCIDCTTGSFLKNYFSRVLCNSYLKHQSSIVMSHEDDVSDEHNHNTRGYPFEEHGYSVKSIHSLLFESLLSYKIERPVSPGFTADTELSLNAVCNHPSRLDGYNVLLEPAKLEYLLREKRYSMHGAGLVGLTTGEIELLIRERLQSSYIYNMHYSDQHDVVKFNILLELWGNERSAPFRITVALEYIPSLRQVRVITMF